MALEIDSLLGDRAWLAQQTPNTFAKGMEGSEILAIAAHVGRVRASGKTVSNFTIGDFDPKIFPIPEVLRDRIKAELDKGQTNYPPAVGIDELIAAIRTFYKDRLGLDYPVGSVQVGAGARPPIYAAFRTILEPGDKLVFPVPTWNLRYYAYLCEAIPVAVETRPENGFMPTADDLLPHLPTASMVVLNSPLNPCGTVMSPELLREVSLAIVAENKTRRAAGRRPLILLYDQVYWQLTFAGYEHHTPISLVPEIAPYTILVDAISKCWAATGLRVGWSVSPPWMVDRMKPLVGHMGAWAARAEQAATASLLREPALVDPWVGDFIGTVAARLTRLEAGIRALQAEGLPCECLPAQGAIYLSARFDLHGRTVGGKRITSDEEARVAILEHAGTAVVPFTAFGFRENSGWVRFSVGAVTEPDVDRAVEAMRNLLRSV